MLTKGYCRCTIHRHGQHVDSGELPMSNNDIANRLLSTSSCTSAYMNHRGSIDRPSNDVASIERSFTTTETDSLDSSKLILDGFKILIEANAKKIKVVDNCLNTSRGPLTRDAVTYDIVGSPRPADAITYDVMRILSKAVKQSHISRRYLPQHVQPLPTRSKQRQQKVDFTTSCMQHRQLFGQENEASKNNGKGLKPVFKELNEGEKLKLELGNGKELQVEGKGTVGIETHHGNRVLTNVQPMQTKSLDESFYFLIFIDDYSRMSWIYFLESKSETFEKFKHFKAKVEKQSGMFIKSLRSDKGGEFLSNNFNHFYEEYGIHRELTTLYTSEQNGVAEKKNRTVVEMARSILQMKGLSNDFWIEAVSTSIYLLNISPTKAVMNKTPFEAWYGKKTPIRDVVFDESASWDWKNNEEYVSLVDGELTNDGEQTVVESSMETPISTPSTPTPQSYHSPSTMKEEMTTIEKNGTWKMVDLPKGKNAIDLKWVYKTKFAADGSLEKHKARLVAKGHAQQHGINFEETFSPVARFETVRVVLALAAQQQWSVYQFDVKSDFLNEELEEEVYVEQPKGFVKKDSEEKVYKLTKALYGLKQAPRTWFMQCPSRDRFGAAKQVM
ncbi:Retrovirus-related Pol polyprotein from transposon TNT 1-94 [Cucumis melo var. makuwa]|uniref:Retrovirus-related Pol polyprotein from transposon TNT 1-94 n=1 Tax=Cucumis melo var. makuwa TaxID=1194695 RepID=A0A5A7TC06_CUCMM|nr:Retrovirus-related Pol polyprotein from transposon TNT 1-94 [Cucumis melo var. makuwa]TYK05657.1 Retrovirus-related Pol polyprotein from transposon TNT 1-94 [Cucumis melo var. makuwa]